MTVFWIKLLATVHSRKRKMARAAFARYVVDEFEPRREILREFYDFDVVGSVEARRYWVAPTVKPLS